MTTTTDIDALIADAAGTVPADVMQRLAAGRDAIAANPALPIRDLLNILSPRPTAPQMTTAQAARLDQVNTDAKAAGTTIDHFVSDAGTVVVTDTDTDGQRVTATIDRDGVLTL